MSAPLAVASAPPASAASSSSSSSEQPAMTLSDGSTYRGELSSDGVPNGIGRLQLPSGDVLEGSFKGGVPDGRGVRSFTNGDRFEGEFVAGQRTGVGALWNARMLLNCGRWADDKFVESCAVPLRLIPEGKHLSAAAQQAKRNHPDGSLVLLTGTGAIYIGELNAQGQPHGQGATFHPDGTPFVKLLGDGDASNSGRWVDGKLQGRAIQHSADGSRYDGLFKHDERHGIGVYGWSDGGRHEGEWIAGKRSGLGAEWAKDGTIIACGRWTEGELVEECAVPLRCIPDGKFLSAAAQQVKFAHPNESALIPDGTHYIGSLNKTGQPHGRGVSLHPDGSPSITLLVDPANLSKSSGWINGLNGRAVVISTNSHRYDGMFKDGQFEGLGVYSGKDGERFEGEWAAGKRSGLGAEWNKTGKLVQCGRWLCDKLVLSCAVPMRCIPDGEHLSEAAKADRQSQPDKTLLLPSGGHYTGSFIVDTLRLHGAGVEFDSAGAEIRRGEWREGSFRSGWGLILSSDGQSRYVGSVHKGLKHGRGTLTDLRSGAVIEADWIDGVAAAGAVAAHGSRFEGQLSPASHLPHGFGARRTAQGAIEIGEFAEGVLVRSCAVLCPKLTIRTLVPPQAALLYPDRSWYSGDLVAGLPHGRGAKFDGAGAELCNGEWTEGAFVQGQMQCADGQYDGAMLGELRHGRGKLTLHSGATIDAFWSEGRAASGAFTAADRSVFEGGLQLNRPHGLGVRWSAQSVMLECGEFVPQNATLLYPDHRWYCGEINAANQRHGQGTLFRESGSEEASGAWIEDRLHGEGRSQWTKGRSYRGQFVFGALTGLGQFRYPNSDLFEGEFVNGKKIGFGVHWNAKGDIVECGVYSAGFLGRQKLTTRPVPRSKLMYGERLSEPARTASLLYPDGSFFVGPLNAQHHPDGLGKLYSAAAALLQAGLWANGVLVRSAMVPLPSAPSVVAAPTPRRWALVLWNSRYEPAREGDAMPEPMPVVELSALNMIDCLRALRFDVALCRNGDRLQMKTAIRSLISCLRSGDLVFIYYIGHGAMVDRETYLLPTDIGSDPVTRFAISVQWIKNKISRRCKLHHCERLTVVMALDCCRTERVEMLSSEDSGADSEDLAHRHKEAEREEDVASENEQSEVYSRTSVSRSIRARESRSARTRDLAQLNRLNQNEYLIMFATEPYLQTFADASFGFFTRALLQFLPVPGLEIGTMFKRVNALLVHEGQQTAHCENTMHNDLFLGEASAVSHSSASSSAKPPNSTPPFSTAS